MGNHLKKNYMEAVGAAVLDVEGSSFLGAGDKYCTYLNYFYENTLQGDDDTKFELFRDLVCSNEALQEVMEDNDIQMPSDSSKMCSQDGFFDSLDETKAIKLYNALVEAT